VPRLSNKVALITGAASGIGAATAALFAREGASVTLVDADAAALHATFERLRAEVPDARLVAVVGDVASEATAISAVAQTLTSFGALHVLVNNAAKREYTHLSEATSEQWHAMLAVNTVGVAQFCKAALPALRAAGGASIVNVSSCYALVGRKNMGLYDATKAAMLALTRTLAHEEAVHGIRANAVCPGSTLTAFHLKRAEAAGKSVEQTLGERQTTSLLGRWAEPIEIARPILWLASDEASFITGVALPVDGGLTAM
jgi:2-hydroxycyclohexanecarboxyl-CoA dehydrogenase